MNVLHLNAIDKGGAWRATYRLHKNLKSAGHNSKIIVANKTIANPDIISIPYFLSKLWKFERLLLLIYEKSLHNGYLLRLSEDLRTFIISMCFCDHQISSIDKSNTLPRLKSH